MIVGWIWQASFWTDWHGWLNAVIFVLAVWGTIVFVKELRQRGKS